MVVTFEADMVSGVEMDQEKFLSKKRGCKNRDESRERFVCLCDFCKECEPCEDEKVEKYGGMLEVIEFEGELEEREVQYLCDDCKDGKWQKQQQLQVFETEQRRVGRVPESWSEVVLSTEEEGSCCFDCVP